MGEGYKVILVGCLRLLTSAVYQILSDKISKTGNNESILTNRELVSLAIENLHPVNRHHFWSNSQGYSLAPHILLWQVKDGLLANFFYPHPLCILPNSPSVEFNSTIDVDIAFKTYPDLSTHYMCQNSDEMALFELTSNPYNYFGYPNGKLEYIQHFALHSPEYHKRNAKLPVFFKGINNFDSNEWEKALNSSKEILSVLDAP